MYLYAFISLEAIAFPHLHHDLALVIPTDSDSEEWNWQHDRETKLQAQGLHSMLQNSQFIVAFMVVKNCLSILKGMTTQLQKRDIDIIEAYSMIDSTKRKIKDLRSNIEEEHKEWFKEAEEVASQVGVDINMPRIAGRQQHRANASDTNVIDYYS